MNSPKEKKYSSSGEWIDDVIYKNTVELNKIRDKLNSPKQINNNTSNHNNTNMNSKDNKNFTFQKSSNNTITNTNNPLYSSLKDSSNDLRNRTILNLQSHNDTLKQSLNFLPSPSKQNNNNNNNNTNYKYNTNYNYNNNNIIDDPKEISQKFFSNLNEDNKYDHLLKYYKDLKRGENLNFDYIKRKYKGVDKDYYSSTNTNINNINDNDLLGEIDFSSNKKEEIKNQMSNNINLKSEKILDLFFNFIIRIQHLQFFPKIDKLTRNSIDLKQLTELLFDVELFISNSLTNKGLLGGNNSRKANNVKNHLSDNLLLIVEENKILNQKIMSMKEGYENKFDMLMKENLEIRRRHHDYIDVDYYHPENKIRNNKANNNNTPKNNKLKPTTNKQSNQNTHTNQNRLGHLVSSPGLKRVNMNNSLTMSFSKQTNNLINNDIIDNNNNNHRSKSKGGKHIITNVPVIDNSFNLSSSNFSKEKKALANGANGYSDKYNENILDDIENKNKTERKRMKSLERKIKRFDGYGNSIRNTSYEI